MTDGDDRAARYLAAYDTQLRGEAETSSAVSIERLGPLLLVAFLGGGEDYELLMAVRPARRPNFLRAARAFPSGATPVGAVTKAQVLKSMRQLGAQEWLNSPLSQFRQVSVMEQASKVWQLF